MKIRKCFKVCVLIVILIIFSGCSKLDNFKENVSLSFYSQEKSENDVKDKQILKMYQSNFAYGKISTLDSRKFSRKYAQTGLWLPYKFIKKIGGGIYFLNKYDSRKIPILFVHGAGGTPLDWEYIIQKLDKTRYQPIIVSYPSGVKLSYTVDIINENLEKLLTKYDINQMVVIAHSMGGLISKSLIKELNKNKKRVDLFITLSTPWGGHAGATNTKDLPYYIPSWNDMKKDSRFIKLLKNNNIFNGVNHYLIFGYKGKITLYGRDNDGTISIESQLSQYAQDGALNIFGFNENHTSILISKKVSKKINIILNDKL